MIGFNIFKPKQPEPDCQGYYNYGISQQGKRAEHVSKGVLYSVKFKHPELLTGERLRRVANDRLKELQQHLKNKSLH